jgi:hypothetical protein
MPTGPATTSEVQILSSPQKKDPALMGGFFFIAFRAVRIWEELALASDGSSRLRSRVRGYSQSLAIGMTISRMPH